MLDTPCDPRKANYNKGNGQHIANSHGRYADYKKNCKGNCSYVSGN